MAALEQGFRIGIDTGGTFTDVVAVERASGSVFATKVPSTPDNPARAFGDGVRAIGAAAGIDAAAIASLSHGTTVATNALLEDRFRGLGLIVTAGFRHLLEIARQSVPEGCWSKTVSDSAAVEVRSKLVSIPVKSARGTPPT